MSKVGYSTILTDEGNNSVRALVRGFPTVCAWARTADSALQAAEVAVAHTVTDMMLKGKDIPKPVLYPVQEGERIAKLPDDLAGALENYLAHRSMVVKPINGQAIDYLLGKLTE